MILEYVTKPTETRTFRKELFVAIYNVNSGLESYSVFRATSKKPPGDKFINTLFVSSQVAGVCCRMDGRVGLVVILASTRLRKATLVSKTRWFSGVIEAEGRTHFEAKAPQPGSAVCLATKDMKSNSGSY